MIFSTSPTLLVHPSQTWITSYEIWPSLSCLGNVLHLTWRALVQTWVAVLGGGCFIHIAYQEIGFELRDNKAPPNFLQHTQNILKCSKPLDSRQSHLEQSWANPNVFMLASSFLDRPRGNMLAWMEVDRCCDCRSWLWARWGFVLAWTDKLYNYHDSSIGNEDPDLFSMKNSSTRSSENSCWKSIFNWCIFDSTLYLRHGKRWL